MKLLVLLSFIVGCSAKKSLDITVAPRDTFLHIYPEDTGFTGDTGLSVTGDTTDSNAAVSTSDTGHWVYTGQTSDTANLNVTGDTGLSGTGDTGATASCSGLLQEVSVFDFPLMFQTEQVKQYTYSGCNLISVHSFPGIAPLGENTTTYVYSSSGLLESSETVYPSNTPHNTNTVYSYSYGSLATSTQVIITAVESLTSSPQAGSTTTITTTTINSNGEVIQVEAVIEPSSNPPFGLFSERLSYVTGKPFYYEQRQDGALLLTRAYDPYAPSTGLQYAVESYPLWQEPDQWVRYTYSTSTDLLEEVIWWTGGTANNPEATGASKEKLITYTYYP